jgi:hypothetical protein
MRDFRDVDEGATIISTSQPASSSKRPSSASSHRRSSSKDRRPKPSHDFIDPSTANISYEDLYVELQEAKKKNLVYESTINNLKVENLRLERELTRQQQRLDKLLDNTMNNRSALSADWRKDTEKSLIVRQYKRQIHELRHQLELKEDEIEAYRKSSKSANILSLAFERDEYFSEVQRLKVIIRDLQDELNRDIYREKRSNAGTERTMTDVTNEFSKPQRRFVETIHTAINQDQSFNTAARKLLRPSSAPRRRKPKLGAAGIIGSSVNAGVTLVNFDDFKASKLVS